MHLVRLKYNFAEYCYGGLKLNFHVNPGQSCLWRGPRYLTSMWTGSKPNNSLEIEYIKCLNDRDDQDRELKKNWKRILAVLTWHHQSYWICFGSKSGSDTTKTVKDFNDVLNWLEEKKIQNV